MEMEGSAGYYLGLGIDNLSPCVVNAPASMDEFINSLLYGEFYFTEDKSLVASTSAADIDPGQEEETDDRSSPESESRSFHTFRTDYELLHRSSRIINLSSAKQIILDKLASIVSCRTPTNARTTRTRGSEASAQLNLYSKPRLPSLRRKNRDNFVIDWEHCKLAKQFDPLNFNARFRRRLRQSLLEEQSLKSLPPARGTELLVTQAKTSTLTCEDDTQTLTATQLCSIGIGTENQYTILCTPPSSVAHGRLSNDKYFRDSKSLLGLEDFTFLLSPESQMSTDIDHGKEVELEEIVGRPQKEKRILDYIMDTLKGWSGDKVVINRIDEAPTAVEVDDHSDLSSLQQTTQIDDEGTCSVVADRSFLEAKKILSKRDRGRPLMQKDQTSQSQRWSYRKTKITVVSTTQSTKQKSDELFIQYMELRKEAVKRGIPNECLPTMPPGSATARKHDKEYFTTEVLHELIDHVTSLLSMQNSEQHPVPEEPESILPNISESDCEGNFENKFQTPFAEDLSWFELQNATETEGQEVEEDLFAMSADVVLGSTKMLSDVKDECLLQTYSEDEDSLAEQIKKILLDRIFKEEDLISEISGPNASNSTRKRRKISKKIPEDLCFSDTESSEDGESIANSERVRRILKSRIKEWDLLSEIGSIHSTEKRKRKPGAKTDRLSHLPSPETVDDPDIDDTSSTRKLNAMILDRVLQDVDLISDITSIASKWKTSSKVKKPKLKIEPDTEVVEVDLTSEVTLDGLDDIADDVEDVPNLTDLLDQPIDCPNEPKVAQDMEILTEFTEDMEVCESEFAHYDEIGFSIWGPMRENVNGGRRMGSKPGSIEILDPLLIHAGMLDEEKADDFKLRACDELSVVSEVYDEFTTEFSADHGKHPSTLVVSKDFHGSLTAISAQPPLEFCSWKRSHTLDLFNKLGFLGVKDEPGLPKLRITDQIGSAKERIMARKTKGSTTNSKAVSKLILKVSIYHSNPGEHLERLGNRYFTSKWTAPTVELEFSETQLVLELRNSLHCLKDCVTTLGYDTTKAFRLTLEDVAYSTNPDWYMLIDDTCIYDGRHSGSIEAANEFALRSQDAFKKTLFFLDASQTNLGDLNIRFGYPYRLFHQDGCMHTFVFNGARLSEDVDELNSPFPKYVQENTFPDLIKCELDDDTIAEWIVAGSSKIEDKDFLFTCKECANEILNSERQQEVINWTTAFRIQYDSTTGIGSVPDRSIGWKSIPSSLAQSKPYQIDADKPPDLLPKPTVIYVQVPDEPASPKLYRFIQPFLLHKDIKNYRKKLERKPKAVKEVPAAPKKRGRKPNSKLSNYMLKRLKEKCI